MFLLLGLYTLHILLDTLTAPTPLLWPLTSTAHMLKLRIDTRIAGTSITIQPRLETAISQMNTKPQDVVEGPLVDTTGIVLATAAAIVALIEHLRKGRGKGAER